jgi:hypothetical protein
MKMKDREFMMLYGAILVAPRYADSTFVQACGLLTLICGLVFFFIDWARS